MAFTINPEDGGEGRIWNTDYMYKIVKMMGEHPEDVDMIRFHAYTDMETTTCGTTMCFAGHAIWHSELREEMQDQLDCTTVVDHDWYLHAGAYVLGISVEQGMRLFYPSYWPEKMRLDFVAWNIQSEATLSKINIIRSVGEDYKVANGMGEMLGMKEWIDHLKECRTKEYEVFKERFNFFIKTNGTDEPLD